MEMPKITSETEVNASSLACVLGVTGRYIRQLVEDGVLTKNGSGGFNLAESVRAFFKAAEKDKESEEDRKIERTKRAADALLRKSKADIAKLEADELRGKMHRQEDVEALVGDMIFAMRSAWLAFPGRVAVDVAAEQTPAECSAIMQREVRKVMRELANYEYDPKRYEERVRDRRAWDSEREEDDE